MTLEAWVASEMLKRMDRVINHFIPLELLDYIFFKDENEKHSYFDATSDAMAWEKEYKWDIEEVLEELELQNGLSPKEIEELRKQPNELALLVVNHIAAGLLVSADAEWEVPVVWTKDLLRTSFLGEYMDTNKEGK